MNKHLLKMYSLINEFGEQGEKAEFTKKLLLRHFNNVEKLTLAELYARNFTDAAMGLRIMAYLRPDNGLYKNAYIMLENPQLLAQAMENQGLSRNSSYMQSFKYTVTTNAETGATAIRPLV